MLELFDASGLFVMDLNKPRGLRCDMYSVASC